jgi:hypothetical protein
LVSHNFDEFPTQSKNQNTSQWKTVTKKMDCQEERCLSLG